jgi:hypothetical protein
MSNYKLLYKTIIILSSVFVVGGLVLPNFCFAQTVEIPKDFEEAKGFGMKIIKFLPDATKGAWQEVKQIWQKTWVKWWHNDIYPWFRAMWYERAKPFADKIINKVKGLLGQEIEKRTPILQEAFEKEKQELRQELKQELPGVSKGLWERFKDLIR